MIPARAELLVDCRVPPGMGAEATMARIDGLLDGLDGLEVEFIEQVVGNRSAIEIAADGRDPRLGTAARTVTRRSR